MSDSCLQVRGYYPFLALMPLRKPHALTTFTSDPRASDLATELTVTLADALTGEALGPIHTMTGQKLMLQPMGK